MTDSLPPLSEHMIEQLAISAPRYTSYPTADRFTSNFSAEYYLKIIRQISTDQQSSPLSLYIHIPFCRYACFYCACNKISTKDPNVGQSYLEGVFREIEQKAALFSSTHLVEQIHLGGGTPTFLNDGQLAQLIHFIRTHFTLGTFQNRDWSIEIDPRTISPERLNHLSKLGFNRVSFGIQDTNPIVQKAIGRNQSDTLISEAVEGARKSGFQEIGFDMIYGLPHQQLVTYDETVDRILKWEPDYVTFFNYAHLPSRFTAQRRINESDLPSATTRIALMQKITQRMTEAHYHPIGLDHFARPHTALARAHQEKRLYRNFQGYTARANIDVIGLGVSAISQIGNMYAQNTPHLDVYQDTINQGNLPIYRGFVLDQDDCIRREIIQSIMCTSEVRYADIESQYPIDFRVYFHDEIQQLAVLENLNLLERFQDGFKMTDTGRFFLRHAAMVFDKYLNTVPTTAQYSNTV